MDELWQKRGRTARETYEPPSWRLRSAALSASQSRMRWGYPTKFAS